MKSDYKVFGKEKYVKRLLENKVEIWFPMLFKYAKCKYCGIGDLIWCYTVKNEKRIPVRYDENKNNFIAHFSDCSRHENVHD